MKLWVYVGLFALGIAALACTSSNAAENDATSTQTATATATLTATPTPPAADQTITPTSPAPSQDLPTATVPPSTSSGRPPAANPTPWPTPSQVPAGTMVERVMAPIDAAEIVIRESSPPQIGLNVTAGLPSGCASRHGYTVERSGNVITVVITNYMITGGVCTMIYGMYDLSIDLGSDYSARVTYEVRVNDKVLSFSY